MPGRDGTGPNAIGPRTGWGMGFCPPGASPQPDGRQPNEQPQDQGPAEQVRYRQAPPVLDGYGYGRGLGLAFRRGFGCRGRGPGRGFGWGRW